MYGRGRCRLLLSHVVAIAVVRLKKSNLAVGKVLHVRGQKGCC